MTNLKIYSLFDKVDSRFTELTIHHTDESARRYYINKVNTANEQILSRYKSQGLDVPKHALVNINEFELHCLGEINVENGEITNTQNKNIMFDSEA